jgi:hypothetical protein
MKIHLLTWEDKRYSADKEALSAINKMINRGEEKKRNKLKFIFSPAFLAFLLIIWLIFG